MGAVKRVLLFAIVLALATSAPTLAGPKAKPLRVKTITSGSRGTVLIFVASLCPCTDAHRIMVENLLSQTVPKGIRFYAVFPNLGENQERAEYFFRQIGWEMPYYLDSTGELAAKYKATRTPQTLVLSPTKKVLYSGPIDDSNLYQGRVEHAYLKEALEDVLAGKPVSNPEISQIGGCWIVRDTTSLPHLSEKEK